MTGLSALVMTTVIASASHVFAGQILFTTIRENIDEYVLGTKES